MASGPSILATLGVDTAPLQRDLKLAENAVARSADRMERAQAKGFKKIGGSLGGGAFGFFQDVIGGLGLAGGAAAAVTLLIPKLIDVQKEAARAKEELEWLLMPVQAATHTNEGDLLNRIEAINQALKETSKQPGFFGGAIGALSRGLDEMWGGTSDQISSEDKANALLSAREKAEERLQEVRDLQKQEAMRKDMNRMDAEAQQAGMQRRKELSDVADKQAAEAIKNLNQEKSAEIELGNVRSEQAGDVNDALERQKKTQQEILRLQRESNAAKAQEIGNAKKAAKEGMLEEFLNDPTRAGENARRRAAKRREKLTKRFNAREAHELREEERRRDTGARVVVSPGPDAGERAQKAFEKRREEINNEAARAVLNIEKRIMGMFTNE